MPLIEDSARAFMPYPDAEVPHATSGPLSGLSFAVKDLFDVAGYPTSGGQPLMLALSGLRTRNAPTVQVLLDAGARFVGKTLTDELAFSMNGKNAHFGAPVNGAAPQRITGGSSSGSAAAVSNGLCDFALGTDTGGSVRCPANHCGLIGLRPTHGRVSLEGALDLAPSLDTCGWFARDIGTFARVADVLLGADRVSSADAPRLLSFPELWGQVAPEVRDALAPARARIESVLGPAREIDDLVGDIDSLYWHYRRLQGREAWDADGAFLERHQPPLGPGVAERFAWSREVTDAQFEAACAFRVEFRARIERALGDDGVVVLPTMPDVAPLASEEEGALDDYRNRAIRLLCVAGMCGLPQISLPLATRQGAPLGISLLGRAGTDRALVRLAQRILG